MEQEGALPCSQGLATFVRLNELGPRFPAYFLKIIFNIILFSVTRSSKWPLPLKFSYENPICTLPFPLIATYPEISVAYLVKWQSVQIKGSLFQFVTCQGIVLTSFSASFNPHDDHSLSDFRDCLLIILAAGFHIWRPSPSSRRRQAPVNLVQTRSLLAIPTEL